MIVHNTILVMNGKIQKQNNNKNDLKKVSIVTDEEPTNPVHTELDPEVLEALNAKRIKKVKTPHDVDYIPELERDESDFGLNNSD